MKHFVFHVERFIFILFFRFIILFSFVFFFFLFSNLLEFFFEDTDKMILLFIAQKLTLCQSRIRVRSIQIFNKTIAGWIFYNLKSKIYSVREYFDDDISTNN